MQPYFFPYIGYFQLINAVDKFVVYDNIQYSKKGWINRNRILSNGKDEYITLPLKKDSDYLDINHRFLSDTWEDEKQKMMNKIINSYRKSPFFSQNISVIENILNFPGKNLFDFIYHSLSVLCDKFEISTEILISSKIDHNSRLKSEERVIAICESLNAKTYINPIGGLNLYNKDNFLRKGIQLQFLNANKTEYQQFDNGFIPYLSIIDLLFFLPLEEIVKMIKTDFYIL